MLNIGMQDLILLKSDQDNLILFSLNYLYSSHTRILLYCQENIEFFWAKKDYYYFNNFQPQGIPNVNIVKGEFPIASNQFYGT